MKKYYNSPEFTENNVEEILLDLYESEKDNQQNDPWDDNFDEESTGEFIAD